MEPTIPGTAHRERDSFVTFQGGHGVAVRAPLLRLTRHSAFFEVHGAEAVLRHSEALADFRVVLRDRVAYTGRATLRSLVSTGFAEIGEATLEEGWNVADVLAAHDRNGKLLEGYRGFLLEWQKVYKVLPEYKVVVSDVQSYLADLRLWLEQLELGIRSLPERDQAPCEREILERLSPEISGAMDVFFDKSEEIAERVPADLTDVHRAYMKRLLHPLILCSPFAFRTFSKPLGYAGDYEMVNMMIRDPAEGSSLLAKLLNLWLLSQAPSEAHRNRIDYLAEKLVAESARVRAAGRRPKIFNLGCGPAVEVQRFLRRGHVADGAGLTLLDFNDETVRYTTGVLGAVQREEGRSAEIQILQKSVHYLLKEASRSGSRPREDYDLVYCAGLFDYLPDPVCKRLMNLLYSMVAPGGLLVATNVTDAMNRAKPFRHSMEYLLDWHLIFRNGRQTAALAPDAASPDDVRVTSEMTGVNVFVEVRKPKR